MLALGGGPAFGERKVSSATDVRASNLYIQAKARPCPGNVFRRAACPRRTPYIYKRAQRYTTKIEGPAKVNIPALGVDGELGVGSDLAAASTCGTRALATAARPRAAAWVGGLNVRDETRR